MYAKGKLTTWNDDKGFGFITPVDGSKQIFIHASGFYYRNKRPVINQLVTYTISLDKNGRIFAREAAFNEAPIFKETPYKINSIIFIIPTFFIFFIGLMVLITELPIHIFYFYIILSIVTFFTYGADKNSAQEKEQRISEDLLHILSLFGGWPGALLAQQKFRHKTKKQPFLAIYWVTVIFNCAGFLWLITPQGLAYLNIFLK